MKLRRRQNQGKIAEFGPALFMLLFVALIPALNLIWLACAYVTIALAANQYALAASIETNYSKSLAGMYDAASSFNHSAWNAFGGMTPVSGYGNCGADLYVKSTSIQSHHVSVFGPNVAAQPPIDSTANVYEFEARAQYAVRPLLNLSAMPFIGEVPGLGRPVNLQHSAHKLVEHPEGLGLAAAETNTFGQQPNGGILNALPLGTGGGGVLPWFHPTIYDLIENQGQSVVKEEVLQVFAINSNWTDTNITVAPGQQVWIDSRADGMWSVGGTFPQTDGDGVPISSNDPSVLDSNFGQSMLIGKMDSNPANFGVGRYKLNLVPPGTGKLWLIMNDSTNPSHYANNTGVQTVRIILTQ